MRYLILLRGVNVGGKNTVSMRELRQVLETAGFTNVSTYINSGNILLDSPMHTKQVEQAIEALLPTHFKLDSDLIRVRALTTNDLQAVVAKAPTDFGTQPDTFHSDVLFPMEGITTRDIMSYVQLHPEVDAAWEQNGVVYFRRLSARRTSSRLGKIIQSPVYKSITIRSWTTTIKLLALLQN